jgi:erythritol transport system ATP-binding protein
MSVGSNLSLASIGSFVRGVFLSDGKEKELIQRMIGDVHVKTSSGQAPIGSLSGGNQQKVVIGKILATEPDVILLDEPSRGIDIGAKGEVFKLLAERAKRGLAVVYSTSEVGECFAVAHRILVMRRGRIVAEFGPDATKEAVMAASGESVVAA